ncbi:hypothetical protein BH20ACI1_BH20ACI1_23710 [soil metagenome]
MPDNISNNLCAKLKKLENRLKILLKITNDWSYLANKKCPVNSKALNILLNLKWKQKNS